MMERNQRAEPMTQKAACIKTLELSDSELEKINRYALKELCADEVFIFKVLACSNEVDRDMESFTIDAISQMAELYRGKTMIFDHQNTAGNQVARIYDTEVLTDETQKTTLGEPYTVLMLHVFLPRLEKNKELIAEIEAGIKKEVSVSCACGKRTCSICGSNKCEHRVGESYEGKICVRRLWDVKDAYEVSFVAVPSQRDAGTHKNSKDPAKTSGEESFEKSEKKLTLLEGFLKFYKNGG